MSTVQVQRYEVEAWLGPALTETTDEQIEAIRVAWQAYYDSPAVLNRGGEPGDWSDQDGEVASAAAMLVFGDDLELERLGRSWRETRALLYARAVGAVHAGMPEAEAARRAGIDRMLLRRLLGKR